MLHRAGAHGRGPSHASTRRRGCEGLLAACDARRSLPRNSPGACGAARQSARARLLSAPAVG
eukprot:5488188-Alexandrium_andersonii.AAC.1